MLDPREIDFFAGKGHANNFNCLAHSRQGLFETDTVQPLYDLRTAVSQTQQESIF